MNKVEVKAWLKSNSEKPDQEIEKFLFSEMSSANFKEDWHKHYFLEDLKSPTNGFSKNVLKIIDEIQKEINGVPMWKRFLATLIDLFILGLIGQLLHTVGVSDDNAVVGILVWGFYFYFSLYKFKATPGLYLFKIKVEFNNKSFLLLRLIARDILWFTLGTGIGVIFYLIYGPYWDKATGARVVWRKEFKH